MLATSWIFCVAGIFMIIMVGVITFYSTENSWLILLKRTPTNVYLQDNFVPAYALTICALMQILILCSLGLLIELSVRKRAGN